MGNVAYILQNIKSICQKFANSFNFFHTNGEIAAVAGDEMKKKRWKYSRFYPSFAEN